MQEGRRLAEIFLGPHDMGGVVACPRELSVIITTIRADLGVRGWIWGNTGLARGSYASLADKTKD